jgi:hypothetical protein
MQYPVTSTRCNQWLLYLSETRRNEQKWVFKADTLTIKLTVCTENSVIEHLFDIGCQDGGQYL